MRKPDIATEWTVCDSDAEWEKVQGEPLLHTAEKVQPARFRMRRLRWSAAAALLLLLSISGVWLWHTAQSGLNQINAELNAAVEQELWAVQQGKGEVAGNFGGKVGTDSQESNLQLRIQRDHTLLKEAVAKAPDGEIVADLEIVRLWADRAVVRVLVQIGDEAYRQSRVYLKTQQGWQQVSPELVALGEWRRLQTDHLAIGYFELDEVMVMEAAPRLDAFFAQAGVDFGYAGAVKGERVEIVIKPDRTFTDRDLLTELSLANNALHLVSPSFQLLPAAASDGSALFQAAAHPLIYPMVQNALDRARKPQSVAIAWLPLLSALRLWEFWQSDAPLAEWKDEIIALKMLRYHSPDNIPAAYDDICQAYRMWNLSPSSMSIPLHCESTWGEPLLTSKMPDTLNGLLSVGVYCTPSGSACMVADEIGLTTVLDYAVATYGREQLPLLVGALGEHKRWESLIPAVFGVPLDEFESGWQAYLTEHDR